MVPPSKTQPVKSEFSVVVKVSANGTVNYAVLKEGKIRCADKLGLSAGRVYLSMPVVKDGEAYLPDAPQATRDFVKAVVLKGMQLGATDGLSIVEAILADAVGVPYPKGSRGRSTDKAEVSWEDVEVAGA